MKKKVTVTATARSVIAGKMVDSGRCPESQREAAIRLFGVTRALTADCRSWVADNTRYRQPLFRVDSPRDREGFRMA